MTGADGLVARIWRSLEADHLYVDPALRDQVSPAQIRAMKADLADLTPTTYVVLYPYAEGDPVDGDPRELLTELHDHAGAPGLYLTVDGLSSPEYAYSVDASWGAERENLYQVTAVAEDRHPDQPVAALVESVDLLTQDPVAVSRAYDALDRGDTARGETSTPSSTPSSAPADDAPSTAWVAPSLVLVVVVVAIALRRWRGGRRRTHLRARTLALPASVLEHVREAQDRQLAGRADREVLALGEALDAAEIGPRDDRTAWQAALDHYDAAQEVLRRHDGRPDVLDVVGAIVLAERGRDALAAARGRRAFRPRPRCYLNPLHPEPTGTATVESGGRRVAVPLCADCRADLEADRTPDVLDVVRRGKPLHYFETGDRPWAETGYGALDDDLLGHLHTRS